jgi:hypothetical protein
MDRRLIRREMTVRTAALLVVAAALVLAGAALPAAAAPVLPEVDGLASSTHADQNRWYSNPYPAFHWQPTIGVEGYSWLFTRVPAAVPDTTAEVSAEVTFAAATDYGTGDGPNGVAVADVNGDGYDDVLTADVTDNVVSVFLGDDGGGFAARTTFAAAQGPTAIAVADLNRDGKQDLAVGCYDASVVSVLLGDGAGAFAANIDYPTGSAPRAIVTADFNRDGKKDVVTVNQSGASVSVLLGIGDGTLAAKVDATVGGWPSAIAAADLNGDGFSDIVTANHSAHTASVLLGDGDGTFAAKVDYATGLGPHGVALVDLNGDGNREIVTSNLLDGTLSVFLGNGSGAFAAKTDIAAGGGSPLALVTGDFNKDGRQDAATGDAASASVLLGDGNGGLIPASSTAVGAGGAWAIATGDFDTNGRLDLVTANVDGDTTSVLLNTTAEAVAMFGPRANGAWYFTICTVDGGGQGATTTRRVNIDTTRPVTKAPYAASVRRYATATLKYRVDDARPGSPTATVTIKIKNSRGSVVKTINLGTKTVNTTLSARFACTLPKGTYRFYVYGTDQARNTQSTIGSNRLVVR